MQVCRAFPSLVIEMGGPSILSGAGVNPWLMVLDSIESRLTSFDDK